MSKTLDRIQEPVKNELDIFDDYFRKTMLSDIFLLDKILKYIIKRKGKQMRPLFVLLSSAINGGITERTYHAAAMIELLHTATLVHDDVVDDSFERRGTFSINALWKNKIAVLTGDYLLSRGLLLSLKNKEYNLLEITSEAVKLMSEGELLQIQKARSLDISEDIYFDVIRMKTATLFATSCSTGAASAGADKEKTDLMWQFGIDCGIAFQIKDDLLDFKPMNSGKPKGTDLKEKKLTLPLINALQKAGRHDKKKIINMIAHPRRHKDTFNTVLHFIDEMKGFEYAIEKMDEYKQKAISLLDLYPDSEFKRSLSALVNYIIDRDK